MRRYIIGLATAMAVWAGGVNSVGASLSVDDPVGDPVALRDSGPIAAPEPIADIVRVQTRVAAHRVHVRVTFDDLDAAAWDTVAARLRLAGDRSWSSWSLVVRASRDDVAGSVAAVFAWPRLQPWAQRVRCGGWSRRDGDAVVLTLRRRCLEGRSIEHVSAEVQRLRFDGPLVWGGGDDTEWSDESRPAPRGTVTGLCSSSGFVVRVDPASGPARQFVIGTVGNDVGMVTVRGRTSAHLCLVNDVIGPPPVP